MMFVFGVFGTIYIVTLAFLFWGNIQTKEFFLEETTAEKTKFSILIPFRNEADNLPYLLDSIRKIKYPTDCFEIIFINDESEDHSVEIIENRFRNFNKNLSYRILTNERKSASPKKDAIRLAISKATYDWIVTTDADCKIPENWLQIFHSFIVKKEALFMAAPVGLESKKGLIHQFQTFDLLSLQTVTMGSFGMKQPFLCNGANLCYKKEVFNHVNGYDGNNHIASGDDVFLLEKVVAVFPEKVHFLKSKEAIVLTKSEDSWTKIIRQRIRWASKTGKQNNALSKGIGLVVFTVNLLVFIGVFLCFSNTEFLSAFLLFWMVKLLVDYLFIIPSASFFNKKIPFFRFIIASFLYSFITSVVVLRSFYGSYLWKGRTFKK